MMIGEIGEFDLRPSRYSPEALLEYYEGYAGDLEDDIRDPTKGLHSIIRLYAPDFDPSEFPEDGLGQAELLLAAGEVIGGKTEGLPRWEILEKKRRKKEAPLNPNQTVYVAAMATYLGGRFPVTVEDGITEEATEFYADNLHLHEEIVATPLEGKVVLVEAGANQQAKVRRELAEKITDGDIIQVVSGRKVSLVRRKTDDSGVTKFEVNSEYRQVATMLGWTVPQVNPDNGVVYGQALDRDGQPVSHEPTEYDITKAYNLFVGDTLDGERVPEDQQYDIERFAGFTSSGDEPRRVFLVQPIPSDGKQATLRDGVRTVLRRINESVSGLQVAIATNGQYIPYTTVGMADILVKEFPEVAALHVIGDETGNKRDADTHLGEIGRFLRVLGKHLRDVGQLPA